MNQEIQITLSVNAEFSREQIIELIERAVPQSMVMRLAEERHIYNQEDCAPDDVPWEK